MIIRLWSRTKTYDQYVKQLRKLTKWHKWFAWHPVTFNQTFVWLSVIERRLDDSVAKDHRWRYRVIDRNQHHERDQH